MQVGTAKSMIPECCKDNSKDYDDTILMFNRAMRHVIAMMVVLTPHQTPLEMLCGHISQVRNTIFFTMHFYDDMDFVFLD